jgi:hypothetical protein
MVRHAHAKMSVQTEEILATPRGTAVLGYMYGYQPFNPTEGLAGAIATMSIKEIFERFQRNRNF